MHYLLFSFTFAIFLNSVTKVVAPSTGGDSASRVQDNGEDNASSHLVPLQIGLVNQIVQKSESPVMDNVKFIGEVFEVMLHSEDIRKANGFVEIFKEVKVEESETAKYGISHSESHTVEDGDSNSDPKTKETEEKVTDEKGPVHSGISKPIKNSSDDVNSSNPDIMGKQEEVISQALNFGNDKTKENVNFLVKLVKALPVKAGAALLGKFISYEYSYVLQHDYNAKNTMYLAQMFSNLIETNSKFVGDTLLNIFLKIPAQLIAPNIVLIELGGWYNSIYGTVASSCKFYSMKFNAGAAKTKNPNGLFCETGKEEEGKNEALSIQPSPSAVPISKNTNDKSEDKSQGPSVTSNSELSGTEDVEPGTSQPLNISDDAELIEEAKQSNPQVASSIVSNVLLDYTNGQLSASQTETISSNSTIAILLAGLGIAGGVQNVPELTGTEGITKSLKSMFAELKFLLGSIQNKKWEDCQKHFLRFLLHAPQFVDRYIIAELLSFQLSIMVSEMTSVDKLLSIFSEYFHNRLSLKNIVQLPTLLQELICTIPGVLSHSILKNVTLSCVRVCKNIWRLKSWII